MATNNRSSGSPLGAAMRAVEARGLKASSVWGLKPHWNSFTVPKRGGGLRAITAPDEVTKAIASALADTLAASRQWSYEVGFAPGKGVGHALEELRLHRGYFGPTQVLQVDLKNAFSAIRAYQVRRALRGLGWSEAEIRLSIRVSCKNGVLVMGSPLSPLLFALVVEDALRVLSSRLGRRLLHMQAYADDICLVLQGQTSPAKRRQITSLVKKVLWDEARLRVNRPKSHWHGDGAPVPHLGAVLLKSGRISPRPPRASARGRMYAVTKAASSDGPWLSNKGEEISPMLAWRGLSGFFKFLRSGGRSDPQGERWFPMGAKPGTRVMLF